MRPAFVLVAGLLAACASSPIGKVPPLSAVGEASVPAHPPVTALRAALAVPKPETPQPQYTQASLWRSGPESLFGDRRARGLGDIMTIVIDIKDEASIQNSTDRSRSGSDNLSIPSLFGIGSIADRVLPKGAGLTPGVSTTSDSASSGSGSVRRNEEITLRVAATVVDVLPNGHMVIQGTQEVRVNFELRDLQVAGIVRPEDISRRNEITYDKIAGARISYGGRGQITDVQQPRYGQQLLDRILPF
ncbi:MAG: flagellar basal body L-ring protein FlgH [Pseudomonadota bacterium]